ncbi:hypothetical protein KR51_00030490 [Rubidibacter lacunae KORDI 51-2]|uniref:Uncharacterized protein n=1 Tax=Rubidibacter lacunae KORDI 51-2 TaxID=582515 RepID=U5DGW1_9CHRO|nr:hypothetical protein [Rubidibacter lacunae]ERN40502.1 hypothetical protein KR51_00030490 [Rubidibacter lacunae KORDI 51-2]
MLDLFAIAELSRTHCAAICAVLVPGSVALTALALWWTMRARTRRWRYGAAGGALLVATIMVLHVGTWLAVRVVTPVTFVLLALALVCWAESLWAIAAPGSLQRLYGWGRAALVRRNRVGELSR